MAITKITLFFVLAYFSTSCTVVKEYEKISLNDPDMELGSRSSERYTTTFHSYREAAVGGNSGKTGGGCGCN